MSRLSAVLFLFVMASALFLVRTQYESRSLTTDLDRANSEARRLDIEHDRLDVERRAQATPLRVEKLAREQLHMRSVSPAITHYAAAPSDSAFSASSSASGASPSARKGQP